MGCVEYGLWCPKCRVVFHTMTSPHPCQDCGTMLELPRELPRRAYLDRQTIAEKAVSAAVEAVERAGADPRLTQAVVLLDAARNRVADFVDGVAADSRPADEAMTDAEVVSLREWLSSWPDGPNWSDPHGQTVPVAKVTLRRLLARVGSGV